MAILGVCRSLAAPKLLSVIRCTPSSVKGLSAAWKTGVLVQPVQPGGSMQGGPPTIHKSLSAIITLIRRVI